MDDVLTSFTEACRYSAASRCAWPEVHGPAVQVSRRGGLQGAVHCGRHPPCACQQLLERSMYVASPACAPQHSVTAAHTDQTSPRSPSARHPRPSRLSSTPEAPTCGCPRPSATRSLAIFTPSTTHPRRPHTRRTAPRSRSATARAS